MSVRAVWSAVSSVFRRRQQDVDLDDEIRAHLELLGAEYERQGMRPDAARYAARRAFGGVQQMKGNLSGWERAEVARRCTA